MIHRILSKTVFVQATLFLLAVSPQTADAARRLSANVSIDDVPMFHATSDDSGQEDADQIWRGLAKLRLTPTAAFS